MILDILPLAGGTARLVRVYGGEPCVKLPGAVPAPEGEGQWPITELGDYCFSEKPRGLPGPEKICRYERAEDGKLCLTRAFGRDVSGKERYSFDFDAPAAPAQDDELHPICGNFLEDSFIQFFYRLCPLRCNIFPRSIEKETECPADRVFTVT